ncbi:TIGR02444 family protein [Pseudaeromonas paramecii]|uniref:TIGR02444 family protein n=1 Tax=Pseudaeromonas paramecii TaxID=2138166 RepID=A0ABP8QBU3_9GAMM
MPKPCEPAVPSPAELWQATQALYREPGVEALCLQAQDKAGADINLLLLLVLLARRGQGALLPPLLATSQRQAAVLQPWRALRRRLKARVETSDYQALLAHELALEQWAQEGLLSTLTLGKGHGLTDYLTHLGLDQSPLHPALLALATPTAPESAPC